MGKFFQALERAEQERALRQQREREEQPEIAPTARTVRRSPTLEVASLPNRSGQQKARLDSEPGGEPSAGINPRLVSLLAPMSFEAEQYRVICHTIEQMHKEAGLSVIAVSSPAVGDGKTTTAINLAGTLAQSPETKVLLVDMDLRHPSVSSHFGLAPASNHGLTDVILGEGLSLDNAVRSNPSFNLTILPSGHSSIAPHEALKSLRLGELMEEARLRYEYVVLDSPPLIPFPDCRLLEKWIDGFLVVVAAHRTPRKLLEEAINVVDPAKMVGLVLNNDDRPVFGYYSYYTSGSSSNNGREARPGQSRRTGKKASRSLWRRRSALMRFDNQNR